MKSIKAHCVHVLIICIVLLTTTTASAQKRASFKEATANTRSITTSYFDHYMKLDFEAMKNHMDDDISIDDQTSKLLFGNGLMEGKTKVVENFKKTYASILEMKSEVVRTIFSSNIGVFEIELSYKFKIDEERIIDIKKMPLVMVLTVKDDKVIRHRDYGDYNVFLEQYEKQLNKHKK